MLPKIIKILLKRIFVLKGIPSSNAIVSPENLLIIRPDEVISKNNMLVLITPSNNL